MTFFHAVFRPMFRPMFRATLRSLPVLVFTVAMGAATGAGAEGTSRADAGAEAKKHYEEGTKAYNLGEFQRAIAEFKAAYNAKSEPLLLYNIAQSYRLSGDLNQALFFYRSFLRNKPDAPDRREIEGRIKTLEKQVADGKGGSPSSAAPVAASAVTPPPVASPPVTATSHLPPSSSSETPPPVTPLPAATPAAPALPPVAPISSGALNPTPLAPGPGTLSAASSGVDVTTPALPSQDEQKSSPFYKKWWFWTAVGAVVLVGVVVGVAAGRQKIPHDDFGGPFSVTF